MNYVTYALQQAIQQKLYLLDLNEIRTIHVINGQPDNYQLDKCKLLLRYTAKMMSILFMIQTATNVSECSPHNCQPLSGVATVQ